MRVALLEQLGGGIDRLELREQSEPRPAAGQALIRVQAAGVGIWDVGTVSSAAPWVVLPYVPGWEIAGVVEAVADGSDVRPGDRVYAGLFPGGGGFADLALASLDKLARLPDGLDFEGAAALVVAGGTAHEALIDRAGLRAGQTVLITAAAGGVGSLAVQIVAAVGARPLAVASQRNHEYLRGLGVADVFDYHDADWVQQVRAAAPGGVDVLLDGSGAGGAQTREQAIGAVRDGGRAIFLGPPVTAPAQLERGITGDSFAANGNRQRLEAIGRLVELGKLRPQLEAVLPFDEVREALRRVAGAHTRGKVVLRMGH